MMFNPAPFLFALLVATLPAQAGDYRTYAEAITQTPPDGAIFRDDLEAVLDSKVTAYRKKKHRRALEARPDLETAARAQALDIMALGKSGHRSRNGESFEIRFDAFRPDPEKHYASGENAASDRRRGAVDEAKALRLFELWTNSTGHRENLLSERYMFVSSGVVQRGTELWAVQIFWSNPTRSNSLFQ